MQLVFFLHVNLSSRFISLIPSDFSLSSQSFCLEKDHLALPFEKNPENLRELSVGNKQKNPEFRLLADFHLFIPFGILIEDEGVLHVATSQNRNAFFRSD